MSSLALFAETPRAGEHGHFFLVAAKTQPSESQIAEFLKAADKDVSVGMNFIGVGRSVQQLSGTAVRAGREIIVLAGVDVSRIPDASRDRLLALLKKLLDRLEHLVLRGVDWSRLPRAGVVIRSAELGQWLDEIQALDLPETEWHGGPRPLGTADPAPTSKRGWEVRRLTVLVALLSLPVLAVVIGTVVISWMRGTQHSGADGSVARQGLERSHGPEPLDSERAKIRSIAEKWGCSEDDVVRSLLRAANWDRRREADSLSLETGLQDGEVRMLLERVKSRDGVEQLLVSADIDSEPDFRRFAQSFPSSPVATFRSVRQWLFNAWEKWVRLSQSVAPAGDSLPGAESGNEELARMMVEIAKLQPDVGFGDEFRNPATPLFDRQDVMIWHFLNQCRDSMEGHGINRFLGKPVAFPPDSELASFLAAIRANRDEIFDQLTKSRLQAAETVGKSQGQEKEKSVTSAFRAFEDFIEHLARFDYR